MALSGGLMMVDVSGGEPVNFSQSFSCPDCAVSIDEVEPRSFSFNNLFGACPECFGLGYKMEFDEDLMIPDKSLSIDQGAIVVMGWQSCADKGSLQGQSWKRCPKRMISAWIRPSRITPRKSTMCCYTEPEAGR